MAARFTRVTRLFAPHSKMNEPRLERPGLLASPAVDLEKVKARLSATATMLAVGKVRAVVGLSMRASLPDARIGDVVLIRRKGAPLLGEIVGFEEGETIILPLGELAGVGPDDAVESTGAPLEVRASDALLGRVVNGLGQPLDGEPAISGAAVPVDRSPPPALGRRRVDEPLPTGIRVIDGLLTLGQGQRIGLFAGSGVGKSTLLGAIARGTAADVVVVALVGERGREVGEFLEQSLGIEGRKKSVVVVATSDAPALERLRAAQVATAYAEYFRDRGRSVMLLVDSVTRFARAQREVGLSAGEPPARRGYPPSVFALLPRLLERSGQGERGSITAIYTVLVEGGDLDEPIADEVRGIVDGHVVLDRGIAARGRYPAVDVTASLSRVMSAIVDHRHLESARAMRDMVALFESKRDLVLLGAYAKGTDKELDRAIERMPRVEAFLRQNAGEIAPFAESVQLMGAALK
jgi:ATP synthase in type III secretion protein N